MNEFLLSLCFTVLDVCVCLIFYILIVLRIKKEMDDMREEIIRYIAAGNRNVNVCSSKTETNVRNAFTQLNSFQKEFREEKSDAEKKEITRSLAKLIEKSGKKARKKQDK